MKEDKIESKVLNITKGKNHWCDGGYIGFANAWTAHNIQTYV